MLTHLIAATGNREFPDQGSQDTTKMKSGIIKDKCLINTLKY